MIRTFYSLVLVMDKKHEEVSWCTVKFSIIHPIFADINTRFMENFLSNE